MAVAKPCWSDLLRKRYQPLLYRTSRLPGIYHSVLQISGWKIQFFASEYLVQSLPVSFEEKVCVCKIMYGKTSISFQRPDSSYEMKLS